MKENKSFMELDIDIQESKETIKLIENDLIEVEQHFRRIAKESHSVHIAVIVWILMEMQAKCKSINSIITEWQIT